MLFLMISSVTGQICPIYHCKSLPDNICLLEESGQNFVSRCPSGQICSINNTESTSYCIPAPNTQYAWPGEPCSSSECAYGTCNGTHCVGKSQNSSCHISDECEPGLYCSNHRCAKLLSSGSKGCESDFDCKYTAGCSKGKCVSYFSLNEAEKVACSGNFSMLCRSASCYQNYCLGIIANDRGEGVECEGVNDCVNSKYNMSIYPFYFYSDCRCSLNGKKYCGLFPGDKSYRSYLYKLYDWIDSGHISGCNTVRRFASFCIESYWHKKDFLKLMYLTYLIGNYTETLGAEDCLTETLYPDYYEYSKKSWTQLLMLSFSLIITILI